MTLSLLNTGSIFLFFSFLKKVFTWVLVDVCFFLFFKKIESIGRNREEKEKMKPLGWILVVMMVTCFSAKFIHESQSIQDWMWLPKDEYRAKYYMPVQECDRSREFSEYRYACRGPIEHLASSLVNLHDELWRSRRCERHWTNFKVWHSELDSTGRMELRTMTNVFSLKEQLFANDYSSEDADLGLKPFQSEPLSHYNTASCTMTAV